MIYIFLFIIISILIIFIFGWVLYDEILKDQSKIKLLKASTIGAGIFSSLIFLITLLTFNQFNIFFQNLNIIMNNKLSYYIPHYQILFYLLVLLTFGINTSLSWVLVSLVFKKEIDFNTLKKMTLSKAIFGTFLLFSTIIMIIRFLRNNNLNYVS